MTILQIKFKTFLFNVRSFFFFILYVNNYYVPNWLNAVWSDSYVQICACTYLLKGRTTAIKLLIIMSM